MYEEDVKHRRYLTIKQLIFGRGAVPNLDLNLVDPSVIIESINKLNKKKIITNLLLLNYLINKFFSLKSNHTTIQVSHELLKY